MPTPNNINHITKNTYRTHAPHRNNAPNRCTHHHNKTIYTNQTLLLTVILKTQKEQGTKLSWYRCEHTHGWHLTKFANKH